jgi:hypothetical protein
VCILTCVCKGNLLLSRMEVWEVFVAVYNNLFLSLGSVLEQDPARCLLGVGVEEQRDSVSPHSADSPMSLSSPHQHSSASSVSSLSGSDNVRAQTHTINTHTAVFMMNYINAFVLMI